MNYYYFFKKASVCMSLTIQCILITISSFSQTLEIHYYFPLNFELNNVQSWDPSFEKFPICKGETVKINIRFAVAPSGGAQPLILSDQHYSNLTNCRDWDCSVITQIDPLIEGNGILVKEIVPGNCGRSPDSRITLFVKPNITTKIKISWVSMQLFDPVTPSLCTSSGPEIKAFYHYSDSIEIEVKDPQPPIISPSIMAVNNNSSAFTLTSTFQADNWNQYIYWYEWECSSYSMLMQNLINNPGQTTALNYFSPSRLGKREIRTAISQLNNTCFSNFSQPATIVIKPCKITPPGCNQSIVNEIENLSCDDAVKNRNDHHFYTTNDKIICSGPQCNLDDYWQKYKSNITNQIITQTDHSSLLSGTNLIISKILFPEGTTSGPMEDNCAVLKLPHPLSWAINLGTFTGNPPAIIARIGGSHSYYDPVFIRIVEDKKCVINYTLNNHIFYPGKVTRCLVKECDKIKLLTFGEGTTSYPGILGWELGRINSVFGKYLFENVDNRADLYLNSILRPSSQSSDNSIVNSLAGNQTIENKTWEIKELKIKYNNNDTTYLLYSKGDTLNFWNMKGIKLFFSGSGNYSGRNVMNDSTSGTWLFDSVQNKLSIDGISADYVYNSPDEFTVKGLTPVFTNDTLVKAQYFFTFRRQINIWKGVISSAWENPANWSTGEVPDENTDVQISEISPFIPTINYSTKCRSLTILNNKLIYINYNLHITGVN